MEILSRQAAFDIGSNKYFTGHPCKHGHIAERYTQTCVCTACHASANTKQMRRSTLRLQGIRPLTVKAHTDDHAAIAAYADMLNLARGIKIANQARGAPAPQPPAPPETPEQRNARLLRMWTNIHGETIARQMLAMERDNGH